MLFPTGRASRVMLASGVFVRPFSSMSVTHGSGQLQMAFHYRHLGLGLRYVVHTNCEEQRGQSTTMSHITLIFEPGREPPYCGMELTLLAQMGGWCPDVVQKLSLHFIQQLSVIYLY